MQGRLPIWCPCIFLSIDRQLAAGIGFRQITVRGAIMSDKISHKIPHDALVVVADGIGARFFRNGGQDFKVTLIADRAFKPSHLSHDGPSGHRPPDPSDQETDEATFAKQLTHELYGRAHSADFAALVLIADPQSLGQIRPILHKEVQDRIVHELHKTLTKASLAEIENALS
jgi:protein required for attachment to host cells